MAGISFVTLAVDDLETVLDFYRRWFELSDDQIRRGDGHAALEVGEGFSIVLYPREMIAESAGQAPGVRVSSEFLMTREVSSMEEMEALLAAGAAAGGTRAAPPGHEEWGSSGYLLAPEGHLWEIVWFRTE